jgi:hypothetical protein
MLHVVIVPTIPLHFKQQNEGKFDKMKENVKEHENNFEWFILLFSVVGLYLAYLTFLMQLKLVFCYLHVLQLRMP